MNNGYNFYYDESETQTCSIIGIDENAIGEIIIPEESPIGKRITRISPSAFKGNDKITGINIPSSIQSIGASAFENCYNLKRVDFEGKLKTIGRAAFKRCDLREIRLPSIHYIDYAAFSYNSDAIVYIEEHTQIVKGFAFNGCKEINCSLDSKEMELWDADWNSGLGAIDTKKPQKEEPQIEMKSDILDKVEIDAKTPPTRCILNPSNISDEKEGIYYTKQKKFSFSVKELAFQKIPVLKSVQLSFYEKYIILILQKGIQAFDEEELIVKISDFLNVSIKCIKEFISYLNLNNSLCFDAKKGLFQLDKSIHFVLDKNLNNAMFAEFDVKEADCNKIVFIEDDNMFLLEEDLNSGTFKKVGNSVANSSKLLPPSIQSMANQHKDVLRKLFVRYFANTNMHLTKDLTYELSNDKFKEYSVEFDAIVEYKYFPSTQQSVRKSVVVLNDNKLSDNFINSLASAYDYDDQLPKFIELKDEFYDKLAPNTQTLNSIEDEITERKEQLIPIEEKIKEEKSKLKDLKKQQSDKTKPLEMVASDIQSEIDKKDKQIKINEDLAEANKDKNAELVANLKKTIKELENSKVALSKELDEQRSVIEKMSESFGEIEKGLKEEIKVKETQIKTFNRTIQEKEKQQKEIIKEYNSLVSQNTKNLHLVTNSVIKKYPSAENILYRYISDISLWLDAAVSASEYSAFDEVGRNIDMIREMYRKVMQAVFDVCLKNNAQSLGEYLTDSFHIIEIENMMRKRNMALDIKNKLIIFHGLSNAIGHSMENGTKKQENLRKVESFKKLDVNEREKILLAIPNFFNSITFTKTAEKSMVEKLKL